MKTRILGVDICFNRAVCWLLEEMPKDPKSFWKKEVKSRNKDPKKDPMTFYFNQEGLDQLLELQPDAIALEPTGMRYPALLSEVCQQKNIPLLWVGHVQCANYRKQMKLPDKNDLADAFALACYGMLYHEFPSYFIHFEAYPIAEIRELYLQLKSLSRFQVSCLNRIKQQLAYEFPETLDVQTVPLQDGRRALICWLAQRVREGVRKYSYWDNRYLDSVAHQYGIDLSYFTRKFAAIIDDYDLLIEELTSKLKWLVYNPIFEPYNRVFDRFNFGIMLRAVLLMQIYPISRFESIGAFKRRLGAAKVEKSSGSSKAWSSGDGSRLCRCELYLWIVTDISQIKKRPKTELGQKISEFYDNWLKKYYADPAYYQKMMLAQSQLKLLSDFEVLLEKELKDILQLGQLAKLKRKLKVIQSLLTDTDDEEPEFNAGKASKKFGQLVIGKTVGFTARWLYRELKREVVEP